MGGQRPRASQRDRASGAGGRLRDPARGPPPRGVANRRRGRGRAGYHAPLDPVGDGGPAHLPGPRSHPRPDPRGGPDPRRAPEHPRPQDPGVRPVSPVDGQRALRVEQALRLLPDIDALLPLRAFVVRTSRGMSPELPYRTVGKRFVQSGELREFVPRAVARASEHLTALYAAAVEALESEGRGDLPGAVHALLSAGEEEEKVGRFTQARAWYEHALRVAEELRERRPEIRSLRNLGRLDTMRGRQETAARFFQRSLVLAEAEMDAHAAAIACQGLGDVAQAQGKWQGATSWYTRGLQYTESDPALRAALQLGLGEVARARGQLDSAAEWFRQAGALFATLRDHQGSARVLNAWR